MNDRSTNDRTSEVLDEAECWRLLRDHPVGRLAVDIAGHPDIFPVNYLVTGQFGDTDTIVFRSGPGTKLAGAVLNGHVALEIDGHDVDTSTVWSVVVKGRASEIERIDERFAADDLPLFPWIDTTKPSVVKITPASVTGRRFAVADPSVLTGL